MPRTGQPHSEETKRKIGLANKGRVLTEEHRQHMRKPHKKTPRQSPEETIIREMARNNGATYYFYPRICIRGHVANRRVKDSVCLSCCASQGSRYFKRIRDSDPLFDMYKNAQRRAKAQKVSFNIKKEDIRDVYPLDGKCPILGVLLKRGKTSHIPESPSLDRIQPRLGYIPGNIAIISYQANTIKHDECRPEAFEAIASWVSACEKGAVSLDKNGGGDKLQCAKMKVSAKERSKTYGVPFNITTEDVQSIWPKDNRCPILGLRFENGKGRVLAHSATIDRIQPELGYVKGNIAIISHKANIIKNNETTPEIFLKMARWLREKLKSPLSEETNLE